MDSSGVNRLAARMEALEERFAPELEQLAKQNADNIRGTVQGLVYGQFLHKKTGETGQSIDPYLSINQDSISFGISTRNMRTVYHEMGTGPKGTEAGYPGEEFVDAPIVRRSTPWKYFDPNAGLNPDGTPKGAFIQTEGVPPKAFMHTATQMEREPSQKAVAKLMEDLLSGK